MRSRPVANSIARTTYGAAAASALGGLEQRLNALWVVHPTVMECGWDTGRGAAGLRRRSADAVRLCLQWLVEEQQSFNRGIGSYSLKHTAERWARASGAHPRCHISNGAMIAALLLAGFEVERRGINGYVQRAKSPGLLIPRGQSVRGKSASLERVNKHRINADGEKRTADVECMPCGVPFLAPNKSVEARRAEK